MMENLQVKNKRRKYTVIKWLLGVLVLVIVLLTGGSLYMLNYALCPDMIDPTASEQKIREGYPQIGPWMDSLEANQALCDTFIQAEEGVRLHALYVRAPQPTHRTAVIVHGYTDQAMEMMHIGYLYHHDLHFNILLPDLRYAGHSDGDAIQMGWKDREDVMRWISLAPHFFGDSLEMVVHGISMGAATTMMTSGEQLPPMVKCFVEDCGYTSVWDQFKKELKEQFGLPAFPLLHSASLACDLKYGWNFTEASAVEQLKKCHLPMLFIHGDQDDYVPTAMVHELYAAKSEPKELWLTEGVGHARSYQVYPKEYTQKVGEFVMKYLKE